MSVEMDEINIVVNADTKKATTSLSSLKKTVSSLNTIDTSGIGKTGTQQILDLANALSKLSGVGAGGSLSGVVGDLQKLGKLDFSNINGFFQKNVESVTKKASIWERLRDTITGKTDTKVSPFENLQAMASGAANFDEGGVQNITAMATAISRLNTANTKMTNLDNIKSAMGELSNIAKSAENISSTGVQNITDLGNAVRSLTDAAKGNGLEKITACLALLSGADFSNLTNATSSIQKVASLATGGTDAAAIMGTTSADGANGTSDFAKKIASILKLSDKGAKAVDKLKTSVKKILSPLSKFMSSLGRIAMYRMFRFIISSITSAFKEGTTAIYNYSKAIDGKFAKSFDSLKESWNYVKASLGAVSAQFITLIEPSLESMMDALADFSNKLAEALALLNGESSYTKAIKKTTQYADATSEAAEATEALAGAFLGFDEINVLNGSSSAYSFVEQEIDVENAQNLLDTLDRILATILSITVALKLLKGLNALAGLNQYTIGVAMLVAGIGLLAYSLHDIIGTSDDLEDVFTKISENCETLVGGILLIGGGLSLLTGNWIPIAIAAIVALGLVAYKYSDSIVGWFYDACDSLVEIMEATVNFLLTGLQPFVDFYNWVTGSDFVLGVDFSGFSAEATFGNGTTPESLEKTAEEASKKFSGFNADSITTDYSEMTDELKEALNSMSTDIVGAINEKSTDVYMDGSKVGSSVTSYQNQSSRMKGTAVQVG